MNLVQEIPPIKQDRPRVAHRSFPDGGRSCSLGCVWVSKGTLQGAPPTGPEWEQVLEVVATSTSLNIYLGPHVRLLESVFRVYNRGQVLKCVEQHIPGELHGEGNQSCEHCNSELCNRLTDGVDGGRRVSSSPIWIPPLAIWYLLIRALDCNVPCHANGGL